MVILNKEKKKNTLMALMSHKDFQLHNFKIKLMLIACKHTNKSKRKNS